jgi:hypothetical protein
MRSERPNRPTATRTGRVPLEEVFHAGNGGEAVSLSEQDRDFLKFFLQIEPDGDDVNWNPPRLPYHERAACSAASIEDEKDESVAEGKAAVVRRQQEIDWLAMNGPVTEVRVHGRVEDLEEDTARAFCKSLLKNQQTHICLIEELRRLAAESRALVTQYQDTEQRRAIRMQDQAHLARTELLWLMLIAAVVIVFIAFIWWVA